MNSGLIFISFTTLNLRVRMSCQDWNIMLGLCSRNRRQNGFLSDVLYTLPVIFFSRDLLNFFSLLDTILRRGR